MSDETSDRSDNIVLLTRLADEFAERYRRGERPSLSEYVDRYPHLAADIREVFPAMVEIEQVKEDHQEAADQAAAPPAPALQQLGDFRILREVGKGGMGIVYEAEQVSLGRHVALKVLPKSLLPDTRAKGRFEREAKAAAKLHHTNIVPVFGVGEHDGMPYYVMQFIQGHGLDEVLDELKKLPCAGAKTGPFAGGEVRGSGRELSAVQVAHSLLTGEFQGANDQDGAGEAVVPQDAAHQEGQGADAPRPPASSDSFTPSSSSVVLPGRGRDGSQSRHRKPTYWQSVANIGVQVAEALEYAHKQGIKHRDIKPSNLLLDTQGTVWVTDFGLAKADDEQNLTHTGDILGTLRYMPPEAFEGRSDARGDVYSLGLTLYELLAFRPAFDERERNRLIKQVTQAEPARLGKLNRHVPQDLETIVHKAIDKDPKQRYASAGALAEDLQRFIEDEPIKARRVGQSERLWRWCRHNPVVASLLVAVATSLLVGTCIASYFAIQADQRAQEAEGHAKAAREAKETLQHRLYVSDLRQVQHLWGHVPLGRIVELLDGQRPEHTSGTDLRGFEWYYWRRLCSIPHRTFQGHTNYVHDVAYSPDGKQLASASFDGTVRIWDVATSQTLRTLDGHSGRVGSIAFSPDGKRLVSCSWNLGGKESSLVIWDVATGQAIRTLKGHTNAIHRVVMDPDGTRLASASFDGTVRVWDAASGREILRYEEHNGAAWSVAFSPDGRLLATGGLDQTVRICDAATGRTLHTLRGHRDGVTGVAFRPDGRLLASAGHDGEVGLWDVATGRLLALLKGHKNWVQSVSFSPDGQQLASASWDGSVRVWDPNTARELFAFWGHTDCVQCAAFSPDGRQLASGSNDGTVKVWDATHSPEGITLRGDAKQVSGVAFDPNGGWLASADFIEGTIKIWDPTAGKLLRSLPGGNCLAVSPDGKRLASDRRDGTIRVWDAATGQELSAFRAHTNRVEDLAFNPEGTLLASCGMDWDREHRLVEVKVWNWVSGKVAFSLKGHTDRVSSVVFSPDGQRLATASFDNTVKVWDATTGKEQFTLTGHTAVVNGVVFSPDGWWLASASYDQTVRVWDIDAGRTEGVSRLSRTLKGHVGPALSVSFSPDGRRLAAGGGNGTLRIWDAASGHELLSCKGHTGDVVSVAFSPDGQRLASASFDGTVRIWDATPVDEAQE